MYLHGLATDFPRCPPSPRTSPNSSGWDPAHGGPGLLPSVSSEWRGNRRSNATAEKGAVYVFGLDPGAEAVCAKWRQQRRNDVGGFPLSRRLLCEMRVEVLLLRQQPGYYVTRPTQSEWV